MYIKFAAYMKTGGAVDSLSGREASQRDPDRLQGDPETWAITNRMKLDRSKCYILHLG